ncbi:MAG: c-type cytochrome, partial [Chitinophagaceae bacterium]
KVVDSLPGLARHLAVNDNGDIYVKGRKEQPGGMNWALRDLDGDGKADSIINFGPSWGEGSYSTGMRIHNGYLYTGAEKIVYRYQMKPGELVPTSTHENIVVDSGERREHMAKPFAFDGKGHIYVPFGGPSDACQEHNRVPGSPGLRPCPLLDSNAGIWRFDENAKNQFRSSAGTRVATGLRSVVGLDWNQQEQVLYAVAHGRDGFSSTWPQYFTPWQSALLPAETFYRLPQDADAGWPYYYYDQLEGKVKLNPEYGGDGKILCTDPKISSPVAGFPGHWAPNDILFYTGDQFPDYYKNGAFIAFHGSTIRAPYPQSGYVVGFIPFINGVAQPMEIFADGFAGVDTIVNTSDAKHRPMGLAQGPDGSLYISDTEKGAIWRVLFTGDKKSFGAKNLEAMNKRQQTVTYIKDPDPEKDNLDLGKTSFDGQRIFSVYCRNCHQGDGKGDGNLFPPLAHSEWVNGDKKKLITVLLNGLTGEVTVAGRKYNNVMPQFQFLSDQQLADLLSYVRSAFGNQSDSVKSLQVAAVRQGLLH